MAKESTFKNMTLTLLTVTLLASASLGFVYSFTKGPIEDAQNAKINNAISLVLPEFDNRPSADKFTREVDGGLLTFYPASMGDDAVGMAIQTFTKNGFSGQIDLMVGILADGTIHAIEVIAHKETPGLGDKMESGKSDFSVQFQGKHPDEFKLAVTKDGGNVDAITASTISSRAYCEAVQRAYDAFVKEGGAK
ncbi:RnfABCDGE type electron transport complex subunit G [Perlabentimonas gracilis]|uniref:RnfABCDGE type electron transport complex subunit G n=1 Tax=Perlabentimonas gracilis TaxID=2715279 RepID=UPI0014073EF8|nr:RnfABCDGE type electron transport complex subunit G [Perlabentimonas gracilis]NHB67148.1 RnfABCDGE type electron transport complex subunit G [Perlabentimonas gracilis]